MANQANGLLSPWLRNRRINAVLPYLKGRILDYGCGIGALAETCQPDLYFGVDIDPESLRIARLQHPGFKFENGIPENIEFDTAVLLAVIEHVQDPKTLLIEIKKAVKPSGLIILTTPKPAFKHVYRIGSILKIFSVEAEAEHKMLIHYRNMEKLASACELSICGYQNFLFGVNQLFILEKNKLT